jgi:hypothetical protein
MNKLGFLAGDRSGETSVLRGPGQFEELTQTESVQFKLDGLVPAIEGIGRTKADGKLSLQALGLISFDDETGTYRMRAFNDGRWLETEVKLADGGNSITWGFALGEFKTTTVLRIDENGEMDRIRGASNRRPPPAENDGVKGSPQFPLNDSSRSVARCSYWHGSPRSPLYSAGPCRGKSGRRVPGTSALFDQAQGAGAIGAFLHCLRIELSLCNNCGQVGIPLTRQAPSCCSAVCSRFGAARSEYRKSSERCSLPVA